MSNAEGYPDPTAERAIENVIREQLAKKNRLTYKPRTKGGKNVGNFNTTEKSNKN